MIDSTLLQLLSNGGLAGLGFYLAYYIAKRNKELQDFINNRLVKVIENNTRVMENLISIINEMRHEIKEELRRLEEQMRK